MYSNLIKELEAEEIQHQVKICNQKFSFIFLDVVICKILTNRPTLYFYVLS